ncbi:MAG: 2-isopropylmalate synthase [Bacteroidetes bacterium GWE2_41_25]|nr:MAG: 2-isopropylmalate synthase [Bacteroidetes bacterium GWA2_40_15]OFX91612.1 MAG: 2-isopropylmalate synthase [Bacteroidetes bacterium GWE2_41_25]OFY00225.1 MAG: 2-isopropylmalate synthase [Bacteroidetes bacterium GWC2_40_22]OFY59184.1 MAG: 2-isopropylmalate synthase [Bacteroidetes bacterium GWF2_41_9]HAM09773.1 2-isopropylmalate synthase [Bacteroidales bacterium]
MSTQIKNHPLVNTTEPNLLEGTFKYSLPPLIKFDGPIVEYIDGKPVEFDTRSLLKRDIFITDTTFRDGQQARPPYSVEQMVKIYDMLSKLGGPNGVIRQTEFFLYTKNDREALDKCRDLGHKYPECTGWIRANKGDFRLVKEAGLKETGMLTSCSDFHIFQKLKFKDRKECIDAYCEVVEAAFEAGIRPRCHLEDITRSDIDGFVLPFVERLMKMSEQVPDGLKAKIRLCDTMGFGISYPGAELPRSIPKLIYKLNKECGVPGDRLEWHGHNDFHKVLINGATAWLYGCNALNATLFGIGERTGNPPLEGAIIEYISLKGDLNGIDTTMITAIAEYMQSIGVSIPENYPFVGKHFNTTRAGIHAGGLRQAEQIYNIFDTYKLLGRSPRVAITDKSGVDGISIWVNEYLGLKGENRISKIKVHRVAQWVMDQYEIEGRLSTMTDEELEAKVKEYMPDFCLKYNGSLKNLK